MPTFFFFYQQNIVSPVATIQLHSVAKILSNLTHSFKARCMLSFEETYPQLFPHNTQYSSSDKKTELQVTLIIC